MGYPDNCTVCVERKVNADLFKGDLELSVKPFAGNTLKVIIAGMNPTTSFKPPVRCAFALDNQEFPIYEYIVNDIVKASGLQLNHIYATNLIKCSFPEDKEPRRICIDELGKSDDETLKKFLAPFFKNCRKYFEEEIREIKPKILISFGQVAHQLLYDEYHLNLWGVDSDIRDALGKKYIIDIDGSEIVYFVCTYKKSLMDPYFYEMFSAFIKELHDAAILGGIL